MKIIFFIASVLSVVIWASDQTDVANSGTQLEIFTFMVWFSPWLLMYRAVQILSPEVCQCHYGVEAFFSNLRLYNPSTENDLGFLPYYRPPHGYRRHFESPSLLGGFPGVSK